MARTFLGGTDEELAASMEMHYELPSGQWGTLDECVVHASCLC